ncbi:MAG: dTMP kinase [Chloroflexota bacterium]|nr:dTMP kinase [Chloroflexota bacterium]
MNGVLIVFEGPEGSGKSTHAVSLAIRLESAGYQCLLTREPGGTSIGERIRAVLLSQESEDMSSMTEALLHNAARAQHVDEVIRPALAAGKTVISDRFIDSTYAYQGGGRGLPHDQLTTLRCLATREIVPSIRVLLDLPVDLGLARRRSDLSQLNRIDQADRAFHERVRQTYLTLAGTAPDDWVVLDATLPVKSLEPLIDTALRTRLGLTLPALAGPGAEAAGVTSHVGSRS